MKHFTTILASQFHTTNLPVGDYAPNLSLFFYDGNEVKSNTVNLTLDIHTPAVTITGTAANETFTASAADTTITFFVVMNHVDAMSLNSQNVLIHL